MRNLKPLSLFVFFLALACERTFTKMHCTENRCYRKRKYTVCRCGPAPFSPDILQAEAMKGLMLMQLSRALQALCDGTAFFFLLFFFFFRGSGWTGSVQDVGVHWRWGWSVEIVSGINGVMSHVGYGCKQVDLCRTNLSSSGSS